MKTMFYLCLPPKAYSLFSWKYSILIRFPLYYHPPFILFFNFFWHIFCCYHTFASLQVCFSFSSTAKSNNISCANVGARRDEERRKRQEKNKKREKIGNPLIKSTQVTFMKTQTFPVSLGTVLKPLVLSPPRLCPSVRGS